MRYHVAPSSILYKASTRKINHSEDGEMEAKKWVLAMYFRPFIQHYWTRLKPASSWLFLTLSVILDYGFARMYKTIRIAFKFYHQKHN